MNINRYAKKLKKRILNIILIQKWYIKFTRKKAPDFMIIGAMKAGTTSLYQYLSGHPDLICSTIKEPSFFSWKHGNGINEYLRYFPGKKKIKEKLVFEASATYLHHPKSAIRIKQLIPNSKLIIILRDPIERAISHFNYYSSKTSLFAKNNPLSIENREIRQAFLEDINGAEKEWNKQYCRFSRYGEQIQRFYNLFESNKILVLDFEELQNYPKEILNKISNFLDIDPTYFETYRKTSNKMTSAESFDPKKKKELNIYNSQEYSIELPSDLKKELINFYKEDISLLLTLSKTNFSWSKLYK
ncbi:sulfotransferase [Saccharicrinis sp. FJH62]|uniref:sulfotransferase family protein n=1 Tax=Saccharicrinis sp. FJH62 TaxID=3344657 RepID=UPI0035D4025E